MIDYGIKKQMTKLQTKIEYLLVCLLVLLAMNESELNESELDELRN